MFLLIVAFVDCVVWNKSKTQNILQLLYVCLHIFYNIVVFGMVIIIIVTFNVTIYLFDKFIFILFNGMIYQIKMTIDLSL